MALAYMFWSLQTACDNAAARQAAELDLYSLQNCHPPQHCNDIEAMQGSASSAFKSGPSLLFNTAHKKMRRCKGTHCLRSGAGAKVRPFNTAYERQTA
mmetsp:Transcript_27510/g.74423  ORF Transcript_27510/g.74423 Transcript_27510/m.74423 type:complete len:98 (-) Transcript_27510:1246-1539(-)|eukprot:1146840-Pelagomonas_calceolata.AAC.3